MDRFPPASTRETPGASPAPPFIRTHLNSSRPGPPLRGRAPSLTLNPSGAVQGHTGSRLSHGPTLEVYAAASLRDAHGLSKPRHGPAWADMGPGRRLNLPGSGLDPACSVVGRDAYLPNARENGRKPVGAFGTG